MADMHTTAGQTGPAPTEQPEDLMQGLLDALERARAGRTFIGDRADSAVRDRLVNNLGAELFGSDRLGDLVTCAVCGVMGDPGDDCGRAPAGHTLAVQHTS